MFAIEFICLAGALLVSIILVSIQVCFDNTTKKKRINTEQQLLRSLRGINYQLKRQAECSEDMVKVAALRLLEARRREEQASAHQEEEEEERLSRFSPNSSQELGEDRIPM